jgi:hypothetical protein
LDREKARFLTGDPLDAGKQEAGHRGKLNVPSDIRRANERLIFAADCSVRWTLLVVEP